MSAAEILTYAVPLTYFAFLLTEWLWPARKFPPRTGWQWTGIAFLVLFTTVATVLPLYLPVDWMAEHRLFDGTRLGVAGGAIVGYVLIEGVVYVWHRCAHTFDFMWRAFHQIHHGPNRLDIAGSQVFHPTEMAWYTVMPLVMTVFVLGLDPLAASITGYAVAFNSYFQHWNVRTPQWLGYVIQRPESHCEHHRLGVHYYNFSDFPAWDMLFGTFRNPRDFTGEVGFANGADRRMGAMLLFQDVNATQYSAHSLGQKPASA